MLASINPANFNGEIPLCCTDESVTECKSLRMDHTALGKMVLTLPDDITVKFCNLVGGDPGCFHYNSSEASCVLTQNRKTNATHGHCQVLKTGQSFTIENCGPNGHVWKKFNVNALGNIDIALDEDPEVASRIGLDELVLNGTVDPSSLVKYSVKVYYTRKFAEATSDIPGFITQMLAETNQGYANSQVSLQVFLHGLEEATIEENSNPFELIKSFETMKGSVNELLGCADSAILLVTSMTSCGAAHFNGLKTGKTLSATRKDCAQGGFSFGHELAHNFGCHHDPDQITNPFYSDGHGHLIEKGTGTTGYRTLMSFRTPGHETRVNHYSNPGVIYSATNTATGVVGLSNNARVLTVNRLAMAAIGDESPTCPYAPTRSTVSPSISTSTTFLPTSTTQPTFLPDERDTSTAISTGTSPGELSVTTTSPRGVSNSTSCLVTNGLPTLRSLVQNGFTSPDSADDCDDRCEARRHCDYWSYNCWTKQCYIWGFCYDFNRHNKGWLSGPRECGKEPDLPCQQDGSRISLTYRSKQAENLEECVIQCLDSNTCEYWAFYDGYAQSNFFRCRLYSLIKPAMGWSSGLYIC